MRRSLARSVVHLYSRAIVQQDSLNVLHVSLQNNKSYGETTSTSKQLYPFMRSMATLPSSSSPFLENLEETRSGQFPLTVNEPQHISFIEDAVSSLESSILAQSAQDAYVYGNYAVQALTSLHNLDIPWYACIMGLNVGFRLLLIPVIIVSQRCAARAQSMNIDLAPAMTYQRLAKLAGSVPEYRENMALAEELTATVKQKHGNMSPMLLLMMSIWGAVVNGIVFFSIFSAVLLMSQYGVPSMRTEGIFWFPDLTVPEPFGLPVICMVLSFIHASNTIEHMKLSGGGETPFFDMFTKILKVFSLGFLIYGSYMPASVGLLWMTNSLMAILQTRLLMLDPVRLAVGLPTLERMREMARMQREFQSKAMKELQALAHQLDPDSKVRLPEFRVSETEPAAVSAGNSAAATMPVNASSASLQPQMEASSSSFASTAANDLAASSSTLLENDQHSSTITEPFATKPPQPGQSGNVEVVLPSDDNFPHDKATKLN